MEALSLILNAASGAPPVPNLFNVYDILTGLQTTGVHLLGAATVYPPVNSKGGGMSPNTPMLRIRNASTNVGVIRIGDSNISIANTNGYPRAKGEEFSLPVGSAALSEISLKGIWLVVPDAEDLVHFLWE